MRKYQEAELTLGKEEFSVTILNSRLAHQSTANVLFPSCHPKDWLDLGQMAAYHEGSMEGRLIPRCNMGLNRRVKGKGTLARKVGRERG